MAHILARIGMTLAGRERVMLNETQRMLVLEGGRFAAILGPGEHWLRTHDSIREVHSLDHRRFLSGFDRALFRERPDLAEAHLTEVVARPDEVAIVMRDGRPLEVVKPDGRLVLWTDAGPWQIERHPLSETLAVPVALARRLEDAGLHTILHRVAVEDGHVGLLSLDGARVAQLAAGVHRLWNVGRTVAVKRVDTRLRTHEVTGQEILTKDRVTIRVNLTAQVRVIDPVRAVEAVRDFDEALHRSLQLAFRKTLGAMTLDRILAEKVTVDATAAEGVRAEMARIGVEIGEIALKDVILPGEMRDILNRVVAAEKEAEANVIRRREETNATRSLLNTAKVMAENPVMLRLKELEALETIAGRVERLTIHNGTEGLLGDLVKLRD